MYTASFGLRCCPFEDRADAAFFFPAAGHEEAIAAMQYEAQHGEGVGLILGETGTGKTILIRALARRLSDSEKVVVLTVPGNGAVDIMRDACKAFGVSLPSTLQDARGLARLRRHLLRNLQEGSKPILIIDQAEHLSPGDLTDIESLLDLQDGRGRLLRVVLAGHPRFRTLLEQPAFTRLRQLAFTEHRLGSLSEAEVVQYIQHRLSVAGGAGAEFFSQEAMAAIFARSQGVPRVINQVCNAALLAAYGAGETQITSQYIEGFTPPSVATAEYPATYESEETSIYNQSQAHESGIWNPQSARRSADSEAKESRLTSLIQHADRMVEDLKHRLPQAVDPVDTNEDELLGDAREKVLALESRLSKATRHAEQAAARLERAEHTFTRAEQIEARLTAFADQLAEQMDNVQARVAEIMEYAAPLDDARKGLEAAVRQSDLARGNIEQSVTRGTSIFLEQSDKSLAELQGSVSTMLENSTKKIRNSFETLRKETSAFVDTSERSVRSLTTECQQRISQLAQTTQAQLEVATRAAADQVSLVQQKTVEMSDAAEVGERAIQGATQKAHRSADDLNEIIDLAKLEVQNAQGAADRMRVMHMESSQMAARIGADTTAARQVSENVSGLISSAEVKIGQLASTHAAATHLHERLGKLMLNAHPFVERADTSIGQLSDRLGQSEKARTQLTEKLTETSAKIMEFSAHFDRADQCGTRVEQLLKNLQAAIQAAAQIYQKLDTTQSQATGDIVSLQECIAKSSVWLSRMESFNSNVIAAEQTSEKLSGVVAAAASLIREITHLVESAKRRETTLDEKSEAMTALCEILDKAREEAMQASDRMNGHLQLFRESLQKSEGDLSEYQRRIGALDGEIQQVTEQTNAAHQVTAQVQTVVDNAQAQSENLERVCVAVRKVFSGLSQASLNARNQAQELEQFVSQAHQTAGSFKQWLEQVRVRLHGVPEIQTRHSTSASAHYVETPPTAALEREAEMLVDQEPGAAGAHLVEGGLDAVPGQPYPSHAREIAQLIERARISQTAEKELEIAGQTRA